MDPTKIYLSWVETIKEIYTKLGKPEVINEKLARFDELIAESEYDEWLMDGIENEIEFYKKLYQLRYLLWTDTQKFFSNILDNDRNAIRLYRERRFSYLKFTDGLKECLAYLKEKGISINIVSEVTSEEHLKTLPHLLSMHSLTTYFSEIITNHGKIKSNGEIDLSYKGLEKIDGAIYKKLAQDLLDTGIEPTQALIIGDRPAEDVDRPKEYGFKAIQFTGIVKRRISKVADYVISDLRELKKILT